MVHALQEAWRVLVPEGTLIDLRPLCVDVPLEVLFQGGPQTAGMVDMSPDIHLDRAVDAALSSTLREGRFTEISSEYFDFAYYWNSVEELKVEWEEKWKDEAILPEQVVQQAARILGEHASRARLRIRVRMKLGKFTKR